MQNMLNWRNLHQDMPNAPMYVHRLEQGIEALEAAPCDWVDRRMLEEALNVSKWTAWRILKRCGAREGPGGSLVCGRTELIGQLKKLRKDGRFGAEIARRNRVERYLDGMIRYAGRKQTEIARHQAAAELLGSRFAKLPAGVDLDPGELRIRFSGTEDFLRKFGAVVFALRNDYEEIDEFIGRSPQADPGANLRPVST